MVWMKEGEMGLQTREIKCTDWCEIPVKNNLNGYGN